MHKIYTTRYVNFITFICTLVIFIFVNFTIELIKTSNFKLSDIFASKGSIKVQFDDNVTYQNEAKDELNNKDTENNVNKAEENSNTQNDNLAEVQVWNLEIPRIFLKADIHEGTSKEIMDSYIRTL